MSLCAPVLLSNARMLDWVEGFYLCCTCSYRNMHVRLGMSKYVRSTAPQIQCTYCMCIWILICIIFLTNPFFPCKNAFLKSHLSINESKIWAFRETTVATTVKYQQEEWEKCGLLSLCSKYLVTDKMKNPQVSLRSVKVLQVKLMHFDSCCIIAGCARLRQLWVIPLQEP